MTRLRTIVGTTLFSILILTAFIFAPSPSLNTSAADRVIDPAQPIIPVPPEPGASTTQQGAGLFAPLSDGVDMTAALSAEPALIGTRRQRLVSLNAGALNLAGASAHLGRVFDDPGLLLNVFDDRTLVAVNTRITPRPMEKQGYIWFGTIPAIPHSNVILVVNTQVGNTRLTGRILTHTANYYITPSTASGGSVHRVLEINPAAGLADFAGAIANDGLDIYAVLPEVIANSSEFTYPQGTVLAGGDPEIDLMVVYTPAAVAHFGNVANTQTAIEEMVALTNQSYVNSNVSQQIRLIHTTQVDYVENPAPQGSSSSPDLNALTSKGDDLFDEIHALRDVYGADLVMLLAGTPEPPPPETRRYCGIAWLLTGNAISGFSVAESYCTTTVVMPHELGHNMGNTHDEVNGGALGAWFFYSRGYQDIKDPEVPEDYGDFVTVMAYGRNGQCPSVNPLSPVGQGEFCPHIAYWSDPDATYNGKPLGKANTQAARTLNETSGIVAGFRPKRTVTQLVTDGGFETWGAAPETPTWKVNGLRPQDMLVCDGGATDPARQGSCAFRFKGQKNENSQIFQKIPANTLGNGDVLMVDGWVQAINLSGGGRIQVRVKYQQDGKPNGKLDLQVSGGTYGYSELFGTVNLTGDVQHITLRLRFKKPQGAQGRMLVDDVRLLAGALD